MSSIFNILNQNNNDLIFENDFNFDKFYKYKNYIDFHKYFNQEPGTQNITISNQNPIEYSLTVDKFNFYDLLGSIFLVLEFNEPQNFDLNKFLDCYEIKIGNIYKEKITIDMLNIIFNIYKKQNNHQIFNILSNSNNSKIIYIPLYFLFNINHNSYLPIHFINQETITFKITFTSQLKFTKCKNNYLILEYIKFSEKLELKYILNHNFTNKFLNKEQQKNTFLWNINSIHKIKSNSLKTTISNIPVNNEFEIEVNNLVSCFIFEIKNCIVDKLILKLNKQEVIYDSKELKYLNFLNSDFNYNQNNNLYIINFEILKNTISGLIDFSQIQKITANIYVRDEINRNIYFTSFLLNEQPFISITRTNFTYRNDSDILFLSKNIIYYLFDINTNIRIVNENPQDPNIQNTTLYQGFSLINKTLLVDDGVSTLYYIDNINNTSGTIQINNSDLNHDSDSATVSIYSINFNLFYIKNGLIEK